MKRRPNVWKYPEILGGHLDPMALVFQSQTAQTQLLIKLLYFRSLRFSAPAAAAPAQHAVEKKVRWRKVINILK